MSKNISNPDLEQILEPLKHCSICPRECKVDRTSGELGFCRSLSGFAIDSIFPHQGEEPPISGKNGICNLFFSHCNMQCVYCQNYQISDNYKPLSRKFDSLPDIIEKIENILDTGINAVGFVSPSHSILQMKAIIHLLKYRKRNPIFVFNTNGYDKKETIKELEGTIQVYLPDLKYMDDNLAMEYSSAPNYIQIATTAIKEMFRQKGADLRFDDEGNIQSGLIIRHLILPNQVENSKNALRFIAQELSPKVYVSLMSQYYPTPKVKNHPHLGRTITKEEYDEVLEEFENLGFYRGWVQDLDSPSHYQPDFLNSQPFQDN